MGVVSIEDITVPWYTCVYVYVHTYQIGAYTCRCTSVLVFLLHVFEIPWC